MMKYYVYAVGKGWRVSSHEFASDEEAAKAFGEWYGKDPEVAMYRFSSDACVMNVFKDKRVA